MNQKKSIMSSYYLNPYIFFQINNGEILLWNYVKHEQFIIENNFFLEILLIAKTGKSNNKDIAKELLASDIISTTPYSNEEWEWDDLSKIFHIGTSNLVTTGIDRSKLDEDLVAKLYLEECAQLEENTDFFLDLKGPTIDLPAAKKDLLLTPSFLEVLLNRKTCRTFLSKSITLEELSTILYYSFGVIQTSFPELKTLGLKETAIHKVSPSGGGRHPEEAFIVIYRVDHLEPGLYHYRSQDHKLTLLQKGDFEEQVMLLNNNQLYSKGLAFGVYIVGCFYRTWWKYKHSRAYRVVLLDVGHVAQTLQLCATALGFNTWLTAAFEDTEVRKFLGFTALKESPILFVGVGIGTGEAIPEAMYRRLKPQT